MARSYKVTLHEGSTLQSVLNAVYPVVISFGSQNATLGKLYVELIYKILNIKSTRMPSAFRMQIHFKNLSLEGWQ